MTRERDYLRIEQAVRSRLTSGADRNERMQVVVDALWEHLHDRGISWVGFYTKSPDSAEMTLGPRRDKPACSPIRLHGACGRSFLSNRPLLVRDVKQLGPNYVACDPRDQSEVVLPVHEADGSPFGVLDLDSWDLGAFRDSDVSGLLRVLAAAGLTEPSRANEPEE